MSDSGDDGELTPPVARVYETSRGRTRFTTSRSPERARSSSSSGSEEKPRDRTPSPVSRRPPRRGGQRQPDSEDSVASASKAQANTWQSVSRLASRHHSRGDLGDLEEDNPPLPPPTMTSSISPISGRSHSPRTQLRVIPGDETDNAVQTDHHRVDEREVDTEPYLGPRTVLPPPTPMVSSTQAEAPPALPSVEPIQLVVKYLLSQENVRCRILDMAEHVQWSRFYEEEYGDFRSFLQLYSSLLVTSPIGDIVTFRDAAKFVGSRRLRGANRRSLLTYSASIGHVSCTSIAKRIRLDDLHTIYRRRGLACTLLYDSVLHVEYPGVFDLFVFENGSVVWWGLSRSDHWIVDADFITANHVTSGTLVERHDPIDVAHLFPIWWTYSIDDAADAIPIAAVARHDDVRISEGNSPVPDLGGSIVAGDGMDDRTYTDMPSPLMDAGTGTKWRRASKTADKTRPKGVITRHDDGEPYNVDSRSQSRFAEALPHDHFVIPANDRVNVMLAVSSALAQSVNVDYLEHKIGDLSQSSMKLPMQLRSLHDEEDDEPAAATDAKPQAVVVGPGTPGDVAVRTVSFKHPELTEVYQMAGDLFTYKTAEFNLTEEPLLIWERPRYREYYDMAMTQLNLFQRAEWLKSRVAIIGETVGAMASHVHQKNMIRADWLLILLLLVDSIVLLAKLIVAIFFSVERNGGADFDVFYG